MYTEMRNELEILKPLHVQVYITNLCGSSKYPSYRQALDILFYAIKLK